MRLVAVANHKGGVGKTTTAVNLAACFALAGKEVLLMDADPQQNALSALGMNDPEVARFIAEGEVIEASRSETLPGLSVLPISRLVPDPADPSAAERFAQRLGAALPELRGDWLIIDCPPSVHPITRAAMRLAGSVLVPVQCEFHAMEALGRLMQTVQELKSGPCPGLKLEGIVLTLFDPLLTLSIQVADEVRKYFPELAYRNVIVRDHQVAEAAGFGLSVVQYAGRSRGAYAYAGLAREVLAHAG